MCAALGRGALGRGGVERDDPDPGGDEMAAWEKRWKPVDYIRGSDITKVLSIPSKTALVEILFGVSV